LVANCAEDEFDRFAAESPKHRQSGDHPLQLLYLGTVCKTKGILDLLDSCSRLKQKQVDFHLHVVGGFQPEVFSNDVASKLEEYQLEDSVTLHGQLTGDDKFQRFADSDVFCFPTFYESEGFPCVVLEAMAFQLPVVATRWRGIRSIVKHEETGYLVDIHDTQGVADVLQQLANDSNLRERWSKAGRQQFLAEYTIEKHIENMERVFLEVARESKANQISGAAVAT
jgi:glycosyltransferase involved in cell wall biosynthesis